MSKKYGVVDKDLKCINIVMWDGVTPWEIPEGCQLIEQEDVEKGDTCELVNGKVVLNKPVVPISNERFFLKDVG